MFGIGFVCLSVICGNYVWHWVYLFVCYLWELCLALGLSVCLLFVGIMLGIGFDCYLWELCWALGLSVAISMSANPELTG